MGAVIAMRAMKNAALGSYKCQYCGFWHVGTSNSPWKVQARITQLLGPTNGQTG